MNLNQEFINVFPDFSAIDRMYPIDLFASPSAPNLLLCEGNRKPTIDPSSLRREANEVQSKARPQGINFLSGDFQSASNKFIHFDIPQSENKNREFNHEHENVNDKGELADPMEQVDLKVSLVKNEILVLHSNPLPTSSVRYPSALMLINTSTVANGSNWTLHLRKMMENQLKDAFAWFALGHLKKALLGAKSCQWRCSL